ncbi:hypothetical protein CUT44_21685 [Streptomyces carminius]|uniref:Uncharacterized protein n=1 Tax=Streptomyces carminius TaxID=2665496 RepID=A0A2M8LVB5_9ACTN|nr:hypothetical protein [Streptomyces carminius]PJE95859.1 hypothetical protein CUT44_21685 [Streptomyces carminius]
MCEISFDALPVIRAEGESDVGVDGGGGAASGAVEAMADSGGSCVETEVPPAGYAEWRLFVGASDERAVQKVLERVRRKSGLEFGRTSVGRYWKDGHLFEVVASPSVDPHLEEDMRLLVCRVLGSAWALGGPWSVSSAGSPFSAVWSFEAVAEKDGSWLVVPGVEWTGFHVYA